MFWSAINQFKLTCKMQINPHEQSGLDRCKQPSFVHEWLVEFQTILVHYTQHG